MLTVALLSLLLIVGGSTTTLAEAFTSDGFSGVPKIQREKYVSSGLTSTEGTSHPSSFNGMRTSCRCRAAKNAEEANPKDASSSAPKRSEGEPWYWVDEKCDHNFQVTFLDKNDSKCKDTKEESKLERISNLRFKICGNPRPLQRHRTSRFRTYNPSVKYQKSFQDALQKLVFDFDSRGMDYPLFDASEYLAMTIIFRMKRPKNHFVNNRPGPGRLKEKSPPQLSSIRSDVDNMTKFVLDSMNGLMYEDDRQITSIHATKLLDNEDLCSGSIEVYVRSIEVGDVDKIVASSISIIDQHVQ